MSLKDRLNTSNTTTTIKPISKPQEEKQPQYYSSNEIANKIDSLGAIDTILNDDDLNSIFISGAKNVYIQRRGKIHKSTTTYRDNIQLENLIRKYAQSIGVELDDKKPNLSFCHRLGINVSATLPPLSNVPVIFVKSYKDKHANLQALQDEQCISKEIALTLETINTLNTNVLIIGKESTLKTTILSAMSKKLQVNNRGIIIDFKNEFKNDNQNCTNFDFSELDLETKTKLLNSIFATQPDKIYLNDCDEFSFNQVLTKINDGKKGILATMEASNPKEAIEKIAQNIVKHSSQINEQKALTMAYNAFKLIITVSCDEIGNRKIQSLTQTSFDRDGNCCLRDIFLLNSRNTHESTGNVPDFYEEAKLNSLPISSSIFNLDYKHTYQQNYKNEMLNQYKKGNVDILKKFKKELPTSTEKSPFEETETPEQKVNEEIEENIQSYIEEVEENAEFKEMTAQEVIAQDIENEIQQEEESLQATGDELIRRAQEKFEELKRNAQLQDAIQNYEIKHSETTDENI